MKDELKLLKQGILEGASLMKQEVLGIIEKWRNDNILRFDDECVYCSKMNADIQLYMVELVKKIEALTKKEEVK